MLPQRIQRKNYRDEKDKQDKAKPYFPTLYLSLSSPLSL
jgi:hypothetical protein